MAIVCVLVAAAIKGAMGAGSSSEVPSGSDSANAGDGSSPDTSVSSGEIEGLHSGSGVHSHEGHIDATGARVHSEEFIERRLNYTNTLGPGEAERMGLNGSARSWYLGMLGYDSNGRTKLRRSHRRRGGKKKTKKSKSKSATKSKEKSDEKSEDEGSS